MQGIRQNGAAWNEERTIFQERTASSLCATRGSQEIVRVRSSYINEVKARLGRGWIYVVRGQQTMPLRSHVSELQHHVFCKLALNGEVVLRSVLRPQVGFELTVEEQRPKKRIVHGLSGGRGENS